MWLNVVDVVNLWLNGCQKQWGGGGVGDWRAPKVRGWSNGLREGGTCKESYIRSPI